MSLEALFDQYGLLESKRWVLTIGLILVAGLLLHYLEIRIYHRLIKRLKKTKYVWDDALLWALHKPLGLFIWLLCFSYTAKIAQRKVESLEWLDAVPTLCGLTTILLFTWFFMRLTFCIQEKLLLKTDYKSELIDKTSSQAVAQVLQIFILITSGLIILKYFFNISFTGLWALGGVGSFVIGWAAKDLLANFFGAIMIYLDRPFSLGDWIRSPDREIEGIVEYIGWRLTKIRTFDKRPLYIPNSLFATICIENVSRITCRRIKEEIAVSFQEIDQIEIIINDIKSMLKCHDGVDQNMKYSVNLIGVNTSSLNISIICFTRQTDWDTFLEVKQHVILQILKIIKDHNAELAFPTSVLKMVNGENFLINANKNGTSYSNLKAQE